MFGFEVDDVVFELTRRNLSIVDLGIDVVHQGYEPGLKGVKIPEEELVISFVSPPWGNALDARSGLDWDSRHLRLWRSWISPTAVFHPHKLLFAIQAYEIDVTPALLAALTAQFRGRR